MSRKKRKAQPAPTRTHVQLRAQRLVLVDDLLQQLKGADVLVPQLLGNPAEVPIALLLLLLLLLAVVRHVVEN